MALADLGNPSEISVIRLSDDAICLITNKTMLASPTTAARAILASCCSGDILEDFEGRARLGHFEKQKSQCFRFGLNSLRNQVGN
jgi:hypothetical protein